MLSHMEQMHPHICATCNKDFKNKSELNTHKNDKHFFTCTMCIFTSNKEEIMEDHILNTHISANNHGMFNCYDCKLTTKDNVYSENISETPLNPLYWLNWLL